MGPQGWPRFTIWQFSESWPYNGGCYQAFQGGYINWSPYSGAHPSPYSGIRNRWAAMGYENGLLGYPASQEIRSGDNVYQRFQGEI